MDTKTLIEILQGWEERLDDILAPNSPIGHPE